MKIDGVFFRSYREVFNGWGRGGWLVQVDESEKELCLREGSADFGEFLEERKEGRGGRKEEAVDDFFSESFGLCAGAENGLQGARDGLEVGGFVGGEERGDELILGEAERRFDEGFGDFFVVFFEGSDLAKKRK